MYSFTALYFKEHGKFARREEMHMIFQPEQIMKAALKKFTVLRYALNKLECLPRMQAKRTLAQNDCL
jgi:hypothetical protein